MLVCAYIRNLQINLNYLQFYRLNIIPLNPDSLCICVLLKVIAGSLILISLHAM